MTHTIERMLDDYEQGKVSRREVLTGLSALLAVLSGGTALAAEEEKRGSSTFEARGLNHIALRVSDVDRSREFYESHLGMRVISRSGQQSCFMDCGDGNFVALFRGDRPRMDHYCYTIDDYRPAEVVAKLEAAGLGPRRRSNRVYFDDPDGLEVQLSGRRSSWPG